MLVNLALMLWVFEYLSKLTIIKKHIKIKATRTWMLVLWAHCLNSAAELLIPQLMQWNDLSSHKLKGTYMSMSIYQCWEAQLLRTVWNLTICPWVSLDLGLGPQAWKALVACVERSMWLQARRQKISWWTGVVLHPLTEQMWLAEDLSRNLIAFHFLLWFGIKANK